ncbi:MAG: hypothetical protein HeimC3_33780 [Candidatus Heimdallarchaeota archaeon LC_3]|nr:MAG: hypothetical protein HeimC3_33780 [Candidatus Heimdallarchaeota archaeon LC_3]
MQIKKVTVGITRKINLGNYETKDFQLTAEVELEEGESLFDVSNKVRQTLEHQLEGWEMETKGITPKISNASELLPPKIVDDTKTQQNDFICPVCSEKMQKKEGKEYYLCKKHWDYPSMIEKGEVKERYQNQLK